ncbi:preprotein translocase subunit SecG [Chitinophaga horti]|uniref:Protein-export membrane protein SecG n=1 Tax=Chitinophaga horti TaxID=2920382 RepID=A0ABY6IV58_9BACT|nr:preprotein translocase subunit SecG [Chitinophaga horti]UYQ91081.1 preprotein translocase subunit SecG [Chitinophaga horti]
MLIIFGILIVLACVLLGFFVLIQNPKGGGLSGSFGGFGNQVIGVRQTTDVLEKGTWVLAAIIAVMCLTSSLFIGGSSVQGKDPIIQGAAPAQQQTAPAPFQQTPPAQPAPAAPAQ